jgi:hypothetical protein
VCFGSVVTHCRHAAGYVSTIKGCTIRVADVCWKVRGCALQRSLGLLRTIKWLVKSSLWLFLTCSLQGLSSACESGVIWGMKCFVICGFLWRTRAHRPSLRYIFLLDLKAQLFAPPAPRSPVRRSATDPSRIECCFCSGRLARVIFASAPLDLLFCTPFPHRAAVPAPGS